MNQISFFSVKDKYLLEVKNFQNKSIFITHVVKEKNGHKIPLAIQMEIFRDGTSKLTAQVEKA